jgi:hypothetical protein
MALMSKVGQAAANMDDGWNMAMITLTAEEKEEMARWEIRRQRNEWQHPRAVVLTQFEMWSDASDEMCAYLLFRNDKLIAREQWRVPKERHIFFKEFGAALRGLRKAKGPTALKIDNQAVVGSLHRRLSTNKQANMMMSEIRQEYTTE